MKKFRVGVVVLTAVVLVLVLVAVFWDSILLYAAPKTVILKSLTSICTQLEARFENSPLQMVVRNLDLGGENTAQIRADTSNKLLGDIHYDMTVQTNTAEHQLLAQGTAGTKKHALDLALYLDENFLAVSSEELVQGNWYGITYETFAEDIRKIPLLPYVLRDGLIEKWEDSLRNIQGQMLRTYSLPDTGGMTQGELFEMLGWLLLLPGKISDDQILIDGETTMCKRIDYSASGEQVAEYLGQEDAQIDVSFYLYEMAVVRVKMSYAAGEEWVTGDLFLGVDPAAETLVLDLEQVCDGQQTSWSASVWTRCEGTQYSEKWTFVKDGAENQLVYDWDTASGELGLTYNREITASLTMQEREEGLWMQTEDMPQLLQIIDPSRKPLNSPVICSMTVQKGSSISEPEYKNLDQWSLEDFWKLLEGVGGMFGIGVD